MSDTLTTSEVAEELGTDGKTLRKFFRSDATEIEPVGQGSRYHIDADDMEQLTEQFAAWSKGTATRRKNPATQEGDDEPKLKPAPRGKKAKAAPVVLDDEDLELDDEEVPDVDAEPTIEELDNLDNLDDLALEEEDPEPAPAPKPKPKARKKA